MLDTLDKIEFCAECFGILVCALAIGLWIHSSIMYHMYKKKFGPIRTKVLCPETKKPLMDFELMYGHCAGCKFHAICKEKIAKLPNNVKG